jgi:hypothetical protein
MHEPTNQRITIRMLSSELSGKLTVTIWQLLMKKKFTKYTNIGSSFEDLFETKPTVKTDF